jgi:hypothetical protein
MSILSQFNFRAPGNYDTYDIGDIISIVTGPNPSTTYLNGDFVLVDRVYLQNDYPLLFAKLGLINALNTTYNPSTHFYVPNVSRGNSQGIQSNQVYLTQAKITNYMRAR